MINILLGDARRCMEIEIGSSTWRRGITLFYFLLGINKIKCGGEFPIPSR